MHIENLENVSSTKQDAPSDKPGGSTVQNLIVLALSALFATAAFARDLTVKSAVREPNVSYRAYESRARIFADRSADAPKSAVDTAKPFGTAKLPAATKWEDESVMLARFKSFRDLRFLNDQTHGMQRRSTWLYPDDGCFARAALAVLNLLKASAPAPSKVFVFGDLNVRSKNAEGTVTWWYHVAPLVEVAGVKYVLDPAIEPARPLKLEEWLPTMSSTPQNLEVAVCASGTYTPYDSCDRVSDGVEQEALNDQPEFLDAEWSRLESLHRDPARELGDNPPWKE